MSGAAGAEEDLIDYEEDAPEQPSLAAPVPIATNGDAAPGESKSLNSYVGVHSTGFRDFLLKPELLRAISDLGFEHPSEGQSVPPFVPACPPGSDSSHASRFRIAHTPPPCPTVQQECIPQAILGMDVLCQAKSGMGASSLLHAVFVPRRSDPRPLSFVSFCRQDGRLCVGDAPAD